MRRRKPVKRHFAMMIIALVCVLVLPFSANQHAALAAQEQHALVTEESIGGMPVGAPISNTVTISAHPENITVAVGDTATFKVKATGTGTVKYQWQCKSPGASTWSSSSQPGATTNTLTVTTNVNHNGYQYRCKISDNGNTKYSNAATLTVIPKITTQPESKSVTVGNTAVFAVAAQGKGTLKYQWQCKAPGASSWTNSTQTGATTAKLSVSTNVNHNGYQYRCVVTDGNSKKAYSSAATLTITPKITSQPASTSVAAGSTAVFTVSATGKGTLKYQWQCKAPGATSWSNSSQTGSTTSKLSVKTNVNHDGYQYRCVVTDANNKKAYSNAAKLSIELAIVSHPAGKTVSVGSTATFSISVTSKESASYQWQYREPASSTWKNSTQSGAKTSTLSVATTGNHQGYRYRCIVTDVTGKQLTSNSAQLKLCDIPVTSQYFTDTIFRGYVSANCDTDKNGKLSKTELQAVKEINVHGRGISNLKGVEYFTNLEILDCGGDIEIRLYYGSDTEGIVVDVYSSVNYNVDYHFEALLKSNYITSLNLSCNTELKKLICSRNRLTKLDVSKNTKLETLECIGLYFYDTAAEKSYDYRLSSLNVKNNTALKTLNCSGNKLTTLDLSKNTALIELNCSFNEITSLNASPCTKLEELFCNDNKLTSLTISGCTELEELNCSVNNLSSLNLSNNTFLFALYCTFNNLSTLDLSNNYFLYYVECQGNQDSLIAQIESLGTTSYYYDKYGLTEEDIQVMKNLIAELTDSSMNRIEKIKAIHDWIVVNTYYDLALDQHDAHEVLNDGIAVCSGYAALFSAFMDLMGIPNQYVYSCDHAWNTVLLEDGMYYYVDCTWDDPLLNGVTSDYPDGRNLRYTYFLIGLRTTAKNDKESHAAFIGYERVSLSDYDWRSAIGN